MLIRPYTAAHVSDLNGCGISSGEQTAEQTVCFEFSDVSLRSAVPCAVPCDPNTSIKPSRLQPEQLCSSFAKPPEAPRSLPRNGLASPTTRFCGASR